MKRFSALLWVFTLRTATELHRAWHMTLLTSALLLQIKKKFGLRMTWNLGVFRCIFRVEDGDYELHRKVPYDYDSEYQVGPSGAISRPLYRFLTRTTFISREQPL